MSDTVIKRVTATRPVSITAVEAVAECRGISPLELETPLVDVLDADALDDLYDGSHRRAGDDGLFVTIFAFCGCEVCVYDDGTVVATQIRHDADIRSSRESKAALRR
ncbi:HalOD1 output domain-containing protein [Haloprofundus halobius]|uniref:HalOD1 output domain-containing protein n=1 Tax=Haloprofundus halobius TaxID=2876194 RepID=UPI001CCFB0CF|nr:HalOD1 output domain-containing protein [Haloprofundus halobius]